MLLVIMEPVDLLWVQRAVAASFEVSLFLLVSVVIIGLRMLRPMLGVLVR